MKYISFLFLFFLLEVSIFSQNTKNNISKNFSNNNDIIIQNAEIGGSISVSQENNIFYLKGSIQIIVNNNIIFADYIKYNQTTKEIFATGHIKIINKKKKNDKNLSQKKNAKNNILLGNFLYYDIQNESAILYNAKAYNNSMQYFGKKIYKTKNILSIKDSLLTSCNALNPHYYLKVKSIKILKNNQIIAYNVFYYVGGHPVFYWPIFVLTDMGTGILTTIGKTDNKGYFIQNTLHFNTLFFQNSLLLPTKNKFTFDWYQKAGTQFSAQFIKKKLPITYNLDFAVAEYKQRKTWLINDQAMISNYFQNEQLNTLEEQKEFWYKFKNKISYEYINKPQKFSSNFSLYYEYYNNKNFDLEYSDRIEPKTTLEMIHFFNNFTGLSNKTTLNWYAMYQLKWYGFTFYTKAIRDLIWYDLSSTETSKYYPSRDLLPEVKISYNKTLIPAKKGFFKGLRITTYIYGNSEKKYSMTKLVKSTNNVKGLLSFPISLSFFKYISFKPTLGYSFNFEKSLKDDSFSQIDYENFIAESQRKNVQNFYNKNILKIGNHYIYIQFTHLMEYSFYQQEIDKTFNHIRNHYINYLFNINFLSGDLKISTIRDFRTYPYIIKEKQRWSTLKIAFRNELNLLKGFSFLKLQNKLNPKKKFILTGIKNTTNYSILFSNWINNYSQLYIKLGNLKNIIFPKIFDFRISINYMKHYLNSSSDFIDFSWETSLKVHKFWRIKLGSKSKAENYNNLNIEEFFHETANSFNIINEQQMNSAIFKLDNFFFHIEHDLHKWILKLSFIISKKEIAFGSNARNYASFYEQSVYLSLTLKNFNVGIPKSEIFQKTPKNEYH